MKILITGSGGREHALAWRLARDIGKENIFIAPGNAGTVSCGTNLPCSYNDFEKLQEYIISLSIDMVLVGPEEPLVNGFTDLLKKDPRFSKLMIIGPSAQGAMLEGSKDFAKQFMIRHGIPTAAYATFTSKQKAGAQSYIRSHSGPYVMKADGSEARALTHNAYNFSPAWSPDGRKIAFIRSLDLNGQAFLYTMNPDGSGLTALTGGNDSIWDAICWSPDSRFIAVQNSPKDGIIGIYIVDVQTKGITRLTGSGFFAPAWYPLMESGSTSEETPVVREDCTNGWTRLTAGGQAMVMGAPTDPPNRVRAEALIGDNVIGEIFPGTILKVLEGPVCISGLVFWKVQSTVIPGGVGWTAEGDGTEYYLEPYVP